MLTIYKASAGSGKTYTLTGTYLQLIFKERDAFRHLLAVTFTNKATAEMKDRVIGELLELSQGENQGRARELQRLTGVDDIRSQAKVLLTEILQDYSSFDISTIDHFFQQVVRSFSHEMGLQGGYEILLDEDLALDIATDNMLAHLDEPQNKHLLNWLIDYEQRKIDEGRSWRLRDDIASLGKLLFKEQYQIGEKPLPEGMSHIQFAQQFNGKMNAMVKDFESKAFNLGIKALSLIDRCNCSLTDFKYKNTSAPTFFYKLRRREFINPPGKRFLTLAVDAESILSKDSTVEPGTMRQLAGELSRLAGEVAALYDNGKNTFTYYRSAKEILSTFSIFCILKDLSFEIAEYRKEKNAMFLSDASALLQRVIHGSDSPFIYERIGTRLDSFMIDEFQDTSRQQWSNFKPLLTESLSLGHDNMIVGDVKQSIYRFRNSDWELLQHEVTADFPKQQIREETLRMNWRSCRNVVLFNNALFAAAPQFLQNQFNNALTESSLDENIITCLSNSISEVYSDSAQDIPDDEKHAGGHVMVQFVESSEEKQDPQATVLGLLPEKIAELQDQGYALKDIAILVRENKEAAMVAQSLLIYAEEHPDDPHRYEIISNQALSLDGSFAVRLIVSILRWLANREDANLQRYALCMWLVAGKRLSTDPETTDFPKELMDSLLALEGKSLYETAEGMCRLFSPDFPQSEQPYLMAFLDAIMDFSEKETPDLKGFLEWWDEEGFKRNISTADDQDAITIITVHKSKGLGFKAVIVPFCDWEIDRATSRSLIPCRPDRAPFEEAGVIPVKYSSKLGNTIFATDYFNEKLYNYVDNLNDMYVAFTRAANVLIIFAQKPKPPKSKSKATTSSIVSVGDLLWKCLQSDCPAQEDATHYANLTGAFDEESMKMELGSAGQNSARREIGIGQSVQMAPYCSVSFEERLRLSLHAHQLFASDQKRRHGSIMHELLSHIESAEEAESVVEDYLQQGMINDEEATRLSDSLQNLLQNEQTAHWFDGSCHVLNEMDILTSDEQTYRPDRVMMGRDGVTVVDYKFGARKMKSYNEQVRNYIHLIQQMGYQNVTGYLWYVEQNEIIPVK